MYTTISLKAGDIEFIVTYKAIRYNIQVDTIQPVNKKYLDKNEEEYILDVLYNNYILLAEEYQNNLLISFDKEVDV